MADQKCNSSTSSCPPEPSQTPSSNVSTLNSTNNSVTKGGRSSSVGQKPLSPNSSSQVSSYTNSPANSGNSSITSKEDNSCKSSVNSSQSSQASQYSQSLTQENTSNSSKEENSCKSQDKSTNKSQSQSCSVNQNHSSYDSSDESDSQQDGDFIGNQSPVNPLECTIDACDADLADLVETQMEESDLHLDVIFSIFQDKDLGDRGGGIRNDNTFFNTVHQVHTILYEAGDYEMPKKNDLRKNPDKYKTIYKDCSRLYYDLYTGRPFVCESPDSENPVGDINQMMEKLDEVINEIELYFIAHQTTKNKVHISVSSFIPIESLAIGLNEVFGYELELNDVDDFRHNNVEYKKVIKFIRNNYHNRFDYWENELGWEFEVSYSCIYESYDFRISRKIDNVHDPRLGSKIYNIGDGNLYSYKDIADMLGRQPTSEDLGKIGEGKWNDVYYKIYPVNDELYSRSELEHVLRRELTDKELIKIENGGWEDIDGVTEFNWNVQDYIKASFTFAHLGLGIASIFVSPIAAVDLGAEIVEMVYFGEYTDPWHWISIGVDVIALLPVAGGIIKTGFETVEIASKAASTTTKTAKTAGLSEQFAEETLKREGKQLTQKAAQKASQKALQRTGDDAVQVAGKTTIKKGKPRKNKGKKTGKNTKSSKNTEQKVESNNNTGINNNHNTNDKLKFGRKPEANYGAKKKKLFHANADNATKSAKSSAEKATDLAQDSEKLMKSEEQGVYTIAEKTAANAEEARKVAEEARKAAEEAVANANKTLNNDTVKVAKDAIKYYEKAAQSAQKAADLAEKAAQDAVVFNESIKNFKIGYVSGYEFLKDAFKVGRENGITWRKALENDKRYKVVNRVGNGFSIISNFLNIQARYYEFNDAQRSLQPDSSQTK